MRALLINPPYQTITSNWGVGHQVPPRACWTSVIPPSPSRSRPGASAFGFEFGAASDTNSCG